MADDIVTVNGAFLLHWSSLAVETATVALLLGVVFDPLGTLGECFISTEGLDMSSVPDWSTETPITERIMNRSLFKLSYKLHLDRGFLD